MHARPGSGRTVEVFVREPATASGAGRAHVITCDWDTPLALSVASEALGWGRRHPFNEGNIKDIAAALHITLEADGDVHDVSSLTGGDVAMRARDHVVIKVTGLPGGSWN